MKQLIIFILIFNNMAYAQTDSLPDIFIYYSSDIRVVLSGLKKNKDSILKIENPISSDVLIENYELQIEFISDSGNFQLFPNHIILDSASFSELLIKCKLIIYSIQYGYAGAQNYDQLTVKYGVKYLAGGCVYNPSEYSRYMEKLLTIRNGANWEEDYKKEVSKIKRERK